MKKKPFISVIMTAILTVAAVFALVGCGGDDAAEQHAPDKSFQGSVSENSYATTDDAVKGFLAEELNGEATTATFVSYEKVGDLTAEEIAELNLGDGFADATVDSAENGTVTYNEATTSAVSESAEGAKTARVIIIKVGSVYWYYVPVFKSGEAVTNSYMSNVLDFTKYANVTETITSKTTVSAQGQSQSVTVKVTTKIDNDKIYFKQVAPAVTGGSETSEYYFVSTNEGLIMYSKVGSEWSPSSTEFESIDAFLEEAFKIDHSYFVKTDSGFKLASDKFQAYIDNVMPEMPYQGTIKSTTANYYVKDGKLDSASAKLTMKASLMGQSMNVSANISTTYTDFGTTVVNLPFTV